MSSNSNFSERINEKNNIKYRYNELTRQYKELAKKILKQNGYESTEDYLFNQLNKIGNLYPEKISVIEEVRDMYYGDMLLTENSLNRLNELYNKMYELIK